MNVNYTFDLDKAASFLGLMGNEARMHVLLLTVEHEWDVGSLAKEVNISQPALSQHLRKLKHDQLVTTRRDGKTIYYLCSSPAVAAMLKTLKDVYPKRGTKKLRRTA
jgi:DNA-binding transcriptional ArsR family regulator